MSRYQLTYGVQEVAVRCVIYGVAGIGKTTLAAQFPNPIFIDIENGSNQLPIARMPRPTSWEMLMDEIRDLRDGGVPCSTIVVDTADAAEQLCVLDVCSENSMTSIEGFGYGRGYTYLAEKFGKMLDLLGECVERGMNVVIVSHSMARKFERPDEEGAYDRYELKLSRKVAPMVKEWADMLLFCDYKTYVETETSKDGKITKAKAKGGKRIIHTTHHPCWDAKNRFGLRDELPLNYEGLRECVPDLMTAKQATDEQSSAMAEIDRHIERMDEDMAKIKTMKPDKRDSYPQRLKALKDLMVANDITDEDLRSAMASKGYVTFETPVENYQQRLVDGVVASWGNFVNFVKEQRETREIAAGVDVPFDKKSEE